MNFRGRSKVARHIEFAMEYIMFPISLSLYNFMDIKKEKNIFLYNN